MAYALVAFTMNIGVALNMSSGPVHVQVVKSVFPNREACIVELFRIHNEFGYHEGQRHGCAPIYPPVGS